MRRHLNPSKVLLWGALAALLGAPMLSVAAPPLKNLKVLPNDRGAVMKEMKVWNKALGVKCTACHSNIREADVDEPEDTEAGRLKKIARDMVHLTAEVSKAVKAIDPNLQISCFSCHRGSAKVPLEP